MIVARHCLVMLCLWCAPPDIHTTASPTVRFLVRASYLQIYNEVISDLLKPERTNLSIREDKKRGVFVEGLSEWVVRSPAEIYGALVCVNALFACFFRPVPHSLAHIHTLSHMQTHPRTHPHGMCFQRFKLFTLCMCLGCVASRFDATRCGGPRHRCHAHE
jgi:hypothetical protein